MTQRVFDIENEKDMQDLWDIVPERIVKIRKAYKSEDGYYYNFYDTKYMEGFFESAFLLIDWHDKTEITRPVNYKNMIGCVVYFYNEPEYKSLGILKEEINGRTFLDELGGYWDYIEPVKKSELKFYGE